MITVKATNPRTSECHDSPVAMDVDVELTIGEDVYSGELTLLPREQDGLYDSWGSPDHWIDSNLLHAFLGMDADRFACVCSQLAAAAGPVCDREA